MIFLGLFIFFIFLLAYYRKKGLRDQENIEEAFWERENEANHVRRKDISSLPYIIIPLEKFPINICNDPKLIACEAKLKQLSDCRILNLEHQSNTDLKMLYGPANLEALTECGEHFTDLCRTLVSYAQVLCDLNYHREAQTVLEFGIDCGSDHSKNYELLASLYQEQENTAGLKELLANAKTLRTPMKASIISHLENALAACRTAQ